MYKIPDQYHGVPGAIKLVEAKYLYNSPFRLGDGYYGNIGTRHGRSAVYIAGGVIESRIKGTVIAVDNRPCRASEYFKKFGVENTVTFLVEDSIEAAKRYDDGSFRMVFIDCDHTYEGVKSDFEAWESKIGEGGELAFHDSDLDGKKKGTGVYQNVKGFLAELAAKGEWEQVGLEFTLSWWKRVPHGDARQG